jgi:serine/threonine protein kinase
LVNERGEAVIGDLALLEVVQTRPQRIKPVGTPKYRAPELFSGNAFDGSGESFMAWIFLKKADVYAFGVTLWEVSWTFVRNTFSSMC